MEATREEEARSCLACARLREAAVEGIVVEEERLEREEEEALT